MEQITISSTYRLYPNLESLPSAVAALCREAEQATSSSHSPYSEFQVGAALELESGQVIRGSNQENAAYPSGLCAERVAVFAAGALHPNEKIRQIAVTARTDRFMLNKPVMPCGGCLQVLAEYEHKQGSPITVWLFVSGGEVMEISGIRNLLPFQFMEDRLKGH